MQTHNESNADARTGQDVLEQVFAPLAVPTDLPPIEDAADTEPEERYVPRTLAECLAVDPWEIGEGVYQFTDEFKEALQHALAEPIWRMVEKLLYALSVEHERYWRGEQELLGAALAERFPMIAGGIRCYVAHHRTTDGGDTPWNCPGGDCRPMPWTERQAEIERVLGQAPSFDLLSALTQARSTRNGLAPSIAESVAERAELERALMAARTAVEQAPRADVRRRLDAFEVADGKFWVNEQGIMMELLMDHLPGLESVLGLLWQHVREEGFTSATRGEWCCAPESDGTPPDPAPSA